MARARARKSASKLLAENLLRSDWERVIDQAALGVEDSRIARMYLLDAIPQIEIAAELNLDRSTISKRMPRIIARIERAAVKMNIV